MSTTAYNFLNRNDITASMQKIFQFDKARSKLNKQLLQKPSEFVKLKLAEANNLLQIIRQGYQLNIENFKDQSRLNSGVFKSLNELNSINMRNYGGG